MKHMIDRLRQVAGEYWQPVDLVAAVAWAVQAIEELQGAMQAQDNREMAAGDACGVPYLLHGCDWPEAVAETIVCLRNRIAKLDRDRNEWKQACHSKAATIEVWEAVAREADVPQWDGAAYSDETSWAGRVFERLTEMLKRIAELESLARSQADRIAAQSELLSKKAEVVHGQQTA